MNKYIIQLFKNNRTSSVTISDFYSLGIVFVEFRIQKGSHLFAVKQESRKAYKTSQNKVIGTNDTNKDANTVANHSSRLCEPELANNFSIVTLLGETEY